MLQKKPPHRKPLLGFKIFVFLTVLFLSIQTITSMAGSTLKIQYNNKTIDFSGQRVTVKLDNKTISLGKTPGLELLNSKKEEIYMVPVEEVFQKGLGATYSLKNNKLTLKKFDTTVTMTIGSKTAYVNGKKKTLPFAPTNVKYIAAKKTKLLVPAKFLAETFGYSYNWKNNSKTSGTIFMTTPFTLYYDDEWHLSSSTLGKVTYNGRNIDVSTLGGVIIDGTTLVQASQVFEKSDIGAKLIYDKDAGTISISKNDITLSMELGSKTAYINDEKELLNTPPRVITNGSNKKKYVMVPAYWVATNLGYEYNWNNTTRTSQITKKNCTYFDWYVGEEFTIPDEEDTKTQTSVNTNDTLETETSNINNINQTAESFDTTNTTESNLVSEITPNTTEVPVQTETPTQTPEPTINPSISNVPNYILRVTGNYMDGKEQISLISSEEIAADIVTTDSKIVITIPNSVNMIGNQEYSAEEIFYLKKIAVTNSNNTTTITIHKVSGNDYYVEQAGDTLNIYMGTTNSTDSSDSDDSDNSSNPISGNGIKIAVDCGHGANTPGKRTPPIPEDLDFDGDGIIDAYKGSQIREHVANVGVGEYLVEELQRCGFDVYESAFGDEDISLSNRQKNIKNAKSDYSVSIHFNAMGDGKTFNSSNGAGVFYYKTASHAGDSKNLAKAVLSEILKGTPQKSIGVNGAHTFAMCKTTAMGTKASILVECAFMTNLHEMRTMMASDAFWKETAQEIAQGICNYTGVTYIEE